MPRGSGKTTLCQLAVLWATITGKSNFAVLIAANASRADQLLEDIKVWTEMNDALNEDFRKSVTRFANLNESRCARAVRNSTASRPSST